jgi:hypothetical protein
MTMMIRQDEALEILGDGRLAILLECVEAAWARFEATFREWLPLCSPTGMANILRELVVQQARERFVGVRGVVIHDRNVVGGRFLAEIDHKIMLSFKKFTRDFQTMNNPTETSVAFDNQEEGLEGMLDLPRITVGYKLTAYGTMEGIYLAFLVGKEAVWHHDLRTGVGSIEFEFPTPDESAADRERREAEEKRAAEEERRRRAQGTDDAAGADDIEPQGD